MYNDNKKFTKFILETNDVKIVHEIPSDDLGMSDIINAFRTLLIGIGFSEDMVLSTFVKYVDEYGYDKYEVKNLDKLENYE